MLVFLSRRCGRIAVVDGDINPCIWEGSRTTINYGTEASELRLEGSHPQLYGIIDQRLALYALQLYK
jgi:hypothetical protein